MHLQAVAVVLQLPGPFLSAQPHFLCSSPSGCFLPGAGRQLCAFQKIQKTGGGRGRALTRKLKGKIWDCMPETGSWTFRAKADSRLFSLVLHGAVVRKKLEKKRLPRPLHPASWNARTAWLALGHANLHHGTAFSALCTLEMWTRKGALCIRIGFNNFWTKNTFTTPATTSFYCIQFLTEHCFFFISSLF